MASLIPGYEYDIFISYRQKDNKGDKWVSRFVDALKTELEATFKEDLSVYFDENPHDRLQETHNVDKSLEGKLKCLIFIPILSQTYCDPNSYAWQYEFISFLNMTENDNLGKDVRLRSGNVASRIFPIRIHDLEQEDVKLFEKETGSVLRALDFVFKTSTGVIRPLLPNEDHPNDNLNKTFYRDQISKVALAIKEIILAIKKEPEKVVKEKEKIKEIRTDENTVIPEISTKPWKRKFLPIVATISVLLILALLAYPKIYDRDTREKLRSSGERISVAVMPFQNITNDSTWNVWQDGIKDELINYLTNYNEEMEVRQVNSINELLESKGFNNYASITPSVASTISKKLNAKVVIIGSIKQAGDKIRLNAQLIDSNTEEAIKSFQIEGESKVSEILRITDSLKLMVKNYLIISIMKKEVSPVFKQYLGSTKSPEALRLFIDGQKAFMKREYSDARKMFLKALEIDSSYASPAIYLSVTFGNQSQFLEAKKWSLYAYNKRDKMSRIDKIFSEWAYAHYFNDPSEALKCLKKMLEIDDQQAGVYYNIGLHYSGFLQFDKAITEYEKSFEIFNKLGINPMWAYSYTALGYSYHKLGEYKKEKILYNKAVKIFPDDIDLIYRQAVLALSQGKTRDANEYIEKYKSIRNDNSANEAAILSGLAAMYKEADLLNEAEAYYRKALSLDPKNLERINNLSYFLIDKDRGLNEGLELADTLLKLSPDNHSYLHSKGWGLYKQGKYREALLTLQKSWDIRLEKASYYHVAFLHLEAAKKAFKEQENK
jgi:tetratricopeptide (TPR) repeat protein